MRTLDPLTLGHPLAGYKSSWHNKRLHGAIRSAVLKPKLSRLACVGVRIPLPALEGGKLGTREGNETDANTRNGITGPGMSYRDQRTSSPRSCVSQQGVADSMASEHGASRIFQGPTFLVSFSLAGYHGNCGPEGMPRQQAPEACFVIAVWLCARSIVVPDGKAFGICARNSREAAAMRDRASKV